MKLSIVMPAYNEEKRIGNTLDKYLKFFNDKLGNDFEIYVVSNNTTDNTAGVINKFTKKYKQLKYIDIKAKIGKGGAVKHGFKTLNGDYIGFVDADASTSPEAYFELYDKINGNGGIVASRWIKGAKVSPKQSFVRRIASRVFNILVRVFFGLGIRDTQCGAKLFTKKAVKDVVNDFGITQWAFDVDLLYLLKKKGYKVIEIPTTWHDQVGSKLNLKRVSFEMFLAIVRLRLVYSPFKFVVKIYNYLGDVIHGRR